MTVTALRRPLGSPAPRWGDGGWGEARPAPFRYAFALAPAWRRLSCLALALLCPAARAVDAGVYMLFPTVVQGEKEIDWHSGIGSSGAAITRESDSALGLGIGATERWFTEWEVQYRRTGDSGTQLDSIEWENTLALAEPNEWPLDVSVAFEVERSFLTGEGVLVRSGPLLQKEVGNFQANLNILLDRYFQSTKYQVTQIEYQGQVKFRYRQSFEFGLQAFGNVGSAEQTWASYSKQVHRVGPVVLGHIPLAGERSINYNAAFLLGTTAHSPDRTFRFQIEYEF